MHDDVPDPQHDLRYAVAMERIAEHLEESKRVYARIEALEAMVAVQQEQMKTVLEFQGDVKRAFWMVITGGVVVLWWGVQKWIEHGR